MMGAINNELILRKEEIIGKVSSIYFGGGTPSAIEEEKTASILETIFDNYEVDPDAEITLEANPEDLNPEILASFRKNGFNRLSLGLQTLDDGLLKFLNRKHSGKKGKSCFTSAREAGFDNLSVDLIYGIPGSKKSHLIKDLEEVVKLSPEHVSVYGFTLEEKTVFGAWHKKGRLTTLCEDQEAEMFLFVMEWMAAAGYDQYEISNYCLPGYESKHNSGYWKGGSYVGVGPGAHSFDQAQRWWNVSNNHRYMNTIEKGGLPFEFDRRNQKDAVNEYIITSLRIKWGCDLIKILQMWKIDLLSIKGLYIEESITNQTIYKSGNILTLTKSGKLLADHVISGLMIE